MEISSSIFFSIAKAVGMDIQNKIYDALGVCHQTKRVFPGLLAEMTTPVIQEELIKLLVKEGLSYDKAKAAVTASWTEGDSGRESDAVKKVHPELLTLFKILKANDIKVYIS